MQYLSTAMQDKIYYSFNETPVFHKQLFDIADDKLLYAIQNILLENPHFGDVIRGTHGARKARFQNPKTNKGKSGGLRVIYVYLEKSERIYLLLFYPKNKQADLTMQQEKVVAQLVLSIKEEYKEV